MALKNEGENGEELVWFKQELVYIFQTEPQVLTLIYSPREIRLVMCGSGWWVFQEFLLPLVLWSQKHPCISHVCYFSLPTFRPCGESPLAANTLK